MSDPQTVSAHPPVRKLPAAFWVLWPAVVMSLGWGLRGYIGGGPFGAMIPGVLVALALCLLLGYRREAAALAAVMGAIGIGFGGNMTYGQTIGLLRAPDTWWWGLTGLTLKGAIWGLLGGAVLGTALAAPRLHPRDLALACIALIAGCFVGIALINEPKLIYFSDPLNKPRDECWAGLMLGAICWMAALAVRQRQILPVVLRFAVYGFIAGGIGFGGGGLWMALGLQLQAMKAMPWWKFMEFSFGFAFGGGLGLAALHLRNHLPVQQEAEEETPPAPVPAFLLAGVLSLAVFFLWPYLLFSLGKPLQHAPLQGLLKPAFEALIGFVGLGCLLMYLGRRSSLFAWQIAGSITFIHSALDLQQDWGPKGPLTIAPYYGWALALIVSVLVILAVLNWQRRQKPLLPLFLLLLWALMAVGYARGLSTDELWSPPAAAVADAGGLGTYWIKQLGSELIVHFIFTVLVILSTLGALRFKKSPPDASFS